MVFYFLQTSDKIKYKLDLVSFILFCFLSVGIDFVMVYCAFHFVFLFYFTEELKIKHVLQQKHFSNKRNNRYAGVKNVSVD